MELLEELIGKKVTVHSDLGGTERQDVGVLDAAHGQWIRLHKSTAEVLFFSIYKVRLVKPFDPL